VGASINLTLNPRGRVIVGAKVDSFPLSAEKIINQNRQEEVKQPSALTIIVIVAVTIVLLPPSRRTSTTSNITTNNMSETEETSSMGLLAAAAAATAANTNNTAAATTTLANKNKSAGRLNIAEESTWKTIEAAYSGIDSIVISVENGQVPIGGGGNLKSKNQLTRLVSIAGTPIVHITNKVLKKFFPLAKIKNYKDKTRLEMCQIIVQHKINRVIYVSHGKVDPDDEEAILASGSGSNTVTKNQRDGSNFRLVNVLNSIKDDFAKMGMQPTKDDLTDGILAGQKFWENAMSIYNTNREDCDDLLLPDDTDDEDEDEDNPLNKLQWKHHMFTTEDPSNYIRMSDWKQLRKFYKKLNSDYVKCFLNWKKSGTHCSDMSEASDFHKFTKGNMKVLYFFQFLKASQDGGGRRRHRLPTSSH
jgi:hypothetical protein